MFQVYFIPSLFSQIPFKHKKQSAHKPRNMLTKAEKREAKKGLSFVVVYFFSIIEKFGSINGCLALPKNMCHLFT